jgi:hypothetical protein
MTPRTPGYVLMGYAINDRAVAIAASEVARTRLRHARSCDDADDDARRSS